SFAQPSGSSSVRIVVEEQGWGNGRPQDIQKVLESAAAELLCYFPERRIPLIRVVHAVDCPRILYERGKDGEYIIQLSAKDRFWAQYAYQFAHELCHLLSNYDRSYENRKAPENGWFDESLCELASMFVVRKMGDTWETTPPYENWRSFARELRRYADDLLTKT